MKWNDHSRLEGSHAFLGASQFHWLNYDEKKLIERWQSAEAIKRGTELHEYAANAIRLGIWQKDTGHTLEQHINDAIGFGLDPEVVLYYSEFCYGTSDAIGFKNDLLRIHDLKTGKIEAHMQQLYIYAALFCLEYSVKPGEIQMETRIYQNNEIFIDNPTAETILPIMSIIKKYSKILSDIKND